MGRGVENYFCALRNKKLRENARRQNRVVADVLMIPEDEFLVYARRLTCTHFGQPRNRAKGVRPRRHVAALGCKAQINATLQQVDGRWAVNSTNHFRFHNHGISKERFSQYPRVRARLPGHVRDTVDTLMTTSNVLKTTWSVSRTTWSVEVPVSASSLLVQSQKRSKSKKKSTHASWSKLSSSYKSKGTFFALLAMDKTVS
ncbi:TPA: hypothetical protein N0F65_000465 [Lagenidium giganteum]|uniref:FAR1 domain-containing protein n=1 Tax=Lagenidium giganteum TaxID=4803 RepID=A0AAV2Z0I3_9STRA|nr:TPA: hypothetical protein N0F65_000465 [Lagenidium giganteum]